MVSSSLISLRPYWPREGKTKIGCMVSSITISRLIGYKVSFRSYWPREGKTQLGIYSTLILLRSYWPREGKTQKGYTQFGYLW